MAKATKRSAKSKDDGKDGAFPSSIKKFRQLPEIEGFYRFIYENDLRIETLGILRKIISQRKAEQKST